MRRDRDPERAFEEFVELWERFLLEAERPDVVVVVEGERDRRALRRLGWSGGVTLVHRGRTISDTARALADAGRVIVLTDWDTEGGHLAQRLRDHLEAEDVEFDLEYRRRLAHLLRGELAHVEGLFGWARRNGERYRRPLDFLADGVSRPDVTG